MGIPGITPACAGNTAIAISQQGGPRDHPRLRGEYKLLLMFDFRKQGSPPLARGILCKSQ